MGTATDLTREGIAAAKQGDATRAADLLRQATEADPKYEMAWLWRSSVATTDDQKRVFLEQALIANPNSAAAKKGLALLGEAIEAPPELAGPTPTVPIPPAGAVKTVEATVDPSAPARMITGPTPGTFQCSRCGRALHPKAEGCAFCQQKFAPGSRPAAAASAPVVVQKQSGGFGRAAFGVFAILLLIAVLWFVGVFDSGSSSRSSYRVEYRVTGSGGDASAASLTYENIGGSEQVENIRLPWSKSFTARGGQFVYISVQNERESGSVTCEILLDGVVVKTATSQGGHTIATCSGRI